MSQRTSEYKRTALDFYETPEWVTRALLPHLPRGKHRIWEPCAGNGKMAVPLMEAGHDVVVSDIAAPADPLPGMADMTVVDFMEAERPAGIVGIVTNPPFGRIGPKLLKRAIEHVLDIRGFAAMLFPTDFDAAINRAGLFSEAVAFDRKLVLRKRIIWFDAPEGKVAAPSMNHAWYIWDMHRKGGPATIHYHGWPK